MRHGCCAVLRCAALCRAAVGMQGVSCCAWRLSGGAPGSVVAGLPLPAHVSCWRLLTLPVLLLLVVVVLLLLLLPLLLLLLPPPTGLLSLLPPCGVHTETCRSLVVPRMHVSKRFMCG